MTLTIPSLLNSLKDGLETITLEDGSKRYIVEGDLLLSQTELSAYVRRYVRERSAQREERYGIIGMVRADGTLLKQPFPNDISYCVLRSSFRNAQRYDKAVAAMRSATRAWEDACDVTFVHEHQLDGHEGPREEVLHAWKADPRPVGTVQFVVREVRYRRPIAAAFFPLDDIELRDRQVILGARWFERELGFDPVGVLRHELGHVLGFRHEQIHSDAPPACQGEQHLYRATRPYTLTDYDPQSVMHYFCAGMGSRELVLTELDKQGARELYGAPRTGAA